MKLKVPGYRISQWGLVLFLFLPSFTAVAQTSDTTVVLRDTIHVEAERIYSAANNASFRAADFALRPRNSAQDILRMVPGLVIAQHAGGGKAEQMFLRGFDADHGTDVNLSVDGAPVNMISHGHGQGYADLHFIIPETIEKVDVVKGPYFARYGDLATAGAVTFSTFNVLKENLVKVEGGSFNTYRGVVLLRTPALAEKLDGYFGAELFTAQGYFDAPQDYRRVNLFAKLHSSVGERGWWNASLSAFSSGWDASGQIPQRAIDQGLVDRYGAIDPSEGGSTSRTTAVVSYNSGGNEAFTVTGGFTDYRFRLFSDFTFFLNDSLRGDGIEQTDNRTILSLRGESSRLWELGGALMRTRFGTTLRSDDIAVGLFHDSMRTRLETTVNAAIKSRQLGAYVEQEIGLPWVQFQLGLRADYLNVDVENRLHPGTSPEGVAQQLLLSPKANVAISLNDDATLFLNSGFGFHSNDARAVVSNANARTLPRAFGAEIGVRYGEAQDVISATAAVWMLGLESELVYVGDEGTTEESGRTMRTGIDLETIITLLDWLSFSVDATISRGRFRDLPEGENFIPLAPSLTLTANAVARFDNFSAALRLRQVGDRPANEDNSVRALGYSILDLSTTYRLGAVEFFVNVENLLDAEWNEAQFDTESRLPGEVEPVRELHFTPGTPLSVRGGLAVRF